MVSKAAFDILRLLSLNGRTRYTQICFELALSKTTVSICLKKLIAEGLVKSRISIAGIKVYSNTAKGNKVYERKKTTVVILS